MTERQDRPAGQCLSSCLHRASCCQRQDVFLCCTLLNSTISMHQDGAPILEATIYKGTTLPHIVVRRRAQLTPEGFVTYQVDKNVTSGKVWELKKRTALEPQKASSIRVYERHLRKAGPLRALSAYARDKNVLRLYCFRVEWPDKYAPSHGSSVELGFESQQQAAEWHEQISAQITALGGSNSSNNLTGHYRSTSMSGSMYTPGMVSVEPSPFTSPGSSFPSTPNLRNVNSTPAIDGKTSPTPTDYGSTGRVLRHSNSESSRTHTANGSSNSSKSSGSAAMPGSINHIQHQQPGSAATQAAAGHPEQSCARRRGDQQQHSSTGVVVDECMMRWVPYKHANGMAIYYRQTPQEEGRGMPQASGEYMLSTAVQASPECCVSNLMLKADKNGSVLSTAAFMEVLEDNGDMQVWHMVFHPAGSAGLATVLAAPRYTFMHQVLTSYEEGVYAVLFSSVPDEDVKPEWVERANARSQKLHRAVLRSDPGSGRRKAIWRTPVRCRITGALTLSALEGRSGRDSPQTLVTCIVRADFGGWLGSDSMFYGLGQALGLQEALMDRVLMRVMILKEDVEYSRFKTKPFQLLMVQPEEYDSSNKEEQQQRQSHHGHQRSASYLLQQHQLASLRLTSVPAAAGDKAALGLDGLTCSAAGAAAKQPLLLPVTRRSSVGSPATAGSGQQQPPGAPTSDLMSRTQIAAVQAAARVSAAASALAAHMTNPQQLWLEKRGSTTGCSASETPPGSPSKHPSPGVPSKRPSSSTADVVATSASKTSSAAAQQQQQQQQQIQVSAAECGPPQGSNVTADRFYSVTGSQGATAPADSAACPAPTAASARSAQLDTESDSEDNSDELFVDQEDSLQDSQSPATAAAVDASSRPLPYSDEQLHALIGGSLDRRYWEPIHDGSGTVQDVYSIRGPNYLRDRKKIRAGQGRYKLMAADLVATDHMMDHIGRFLPSVRCNGAAFNFVVDLIINYGNPVLHLVMVFSSDRHPHSLGPCPDDPLDAGDEWTPFDFTMSRFLHGTDEERNGMFKLIPHCAKGSWVVSQSVGTTPVILGRKLATTYHQCDRYIEVDVDVASTQAVAYIVKMVQGATRSMLIDHAYLLESQFAHELPETLIGAIRYKHLDMTDYTFISIDQELPFSPVIPGIVGQ